MYLGSTGEVVTLEELGVRQAFLLLVGEGSSQVRNDPKGGRFACICKYFLYELHVMVTLA